jgi:hypothetical protein
MLHPANNSNRYVGLAEDIAWSGSKVAGWELAETTLCLSSSETCLAAADSLSTASLSPATFLSRESSKTFTRAADAILFPVLCDAVLATSVVHSEDTAKRSGIVQKIL